MDKCVSAGDPCLPAYCDEGTDTCESSELNVPAGNFWMGCEPNDSHCYPVENPRHEVRVSSYYMDVFETTNREYADYLNNMNPGNSCDGHECAYSTHDDSNLGLYKFDSAWQVDSGYEDRPVVMVSWYGAKAYCEALGKRLPTEAEWEKAAKGATEHYIYPWGDSLEANAANYWSDADPYKAGVYPFTTPVGFFDGDLRHGYETFDGRSPYGIHDMAGNAFEWVGDWYQSNYYLATPVGGWSIHRDRLSARCESCAAAAGTTALLACAPRTASAAETRRASSSTSDSVASGPGNKESFRRIL